MSAVPAIVFSNDPDDREELARQCAIDAVADRYAARFEAGEIVAALDAGAESLAWVAASVTIPLHLRREFRDLLERAESVRRDVDAQLEEPDRD